MFVAMVTDLQGKYNFYFDPCVSIPSLNLIAVIMPKLFTVMFWKCRHYTPEPRFQTANQETWITAIEGFKSNGMDKIFH